MTLNNKKLLTYLNLPETFRTVMETQLSKIVGLSIQDASSLLFSYYRVITGGRLWGSIFKTSREYKTCCSFYTRTTDEKYLFTTPSHPKKPAAMESTVLKLRFGLFHKVDS
jgi:hypothetical protein